MAAEESYPERAQVPPRARLGADRGRHGDLGITWYAQDALGEIVHFEPPEPGSSVAKDESYGEVESVKAVSDLDLAALGRGRRGEPGASSEEPEKINEDPYGEGWLDQDPPLRSAGEVDDLLDVGRVQGSSLDEQ